MFKPPPANYVPGLKTIQVQFAEIARLWKWTPEFSGTPMIQLTSHQHLGYYFGLLRGSGADLAPASVDAVREHFEALETAWVAARSRARSGMKPT
jgi:hypothetical protein